MSFANFPKLPFALSISRKEVERTRQAGRSSTSQLRCGCLFLGERLCSCTVVNGTKCCREDITQGVSNGSSQRNCAHAQMCARARLCRVVAVVLILRPRLDIAQVKFARHTDNCYKNTEPPLWNTKAGCMVFPEFQLLLAAYCFMLVKVSGQRCSLSNA
jgi:hypothetical protein